MLRWCHVCCILVLFSHDLGAQGYSPDEAVRRMKVADGLSVHLVASEPQVSQPILVKFDDRGRLWTIQYLQYPNPAGLKRVQVDRWSRTVYDRIPEPPPRGPRGADKISLLLDHNQDGRTDEVLDAITGLNLCTGLEFGHGGLFVLQVPYLLYYPDHDGDGLPDADPEVRLEGFGMEDAQSFANHLTLGPDGWLYGVNGSTTTCRIRGIEFQQGVWRYHPVTREFELFCEGGGNTFGLTFDSAGNLLYTNNGGYLAFHALQGAYYQKSFGKHGPLHNPYAFGYFPDLKKIGSVPGPPSTGGTIYQATAFPAQFHGALISGNFLGHSISWWKIDPLGATFQARHAGLLLDSQDPWSCPTDLCLGPDGAMYWSDFYDQRTAHPDPDANWDRSNGRIYRVAANGAKPGTRVRLRELTSLELVSVLQKPGWHADRARVILAERRDAAVIPELRARLLNSSDPDATLQYLWALHVIGGLDAATGQQLLKHQSPSVRWWTVRLSGDNRQVTKERLNALVSLASQERDITVQCQLAATAKRLRADGLEILLALVRANPKSQDPYLNLMLWWGFESFSIDRRTELLDVFLAPGEQKQPLSRFILAKLLRRYAAEGSAAGYLACVRIVKSIEKSVPLADALLSDLETALSKGLSERAQGLPVIGNGGFLESYSSVAGAKAAGGPEAPQLRQFEPLSSELRQWILEHYKQSKGSLTAARLALLTGDVAVRQEFYRELTRSDDATRNARLELLLELGESDCVPIVLTLLDGPSKDVVLRVLARFDRPEITEHVLSRYAKFSAEERRIARDLCFRHPGSARAFLKLVVAGEVPPVDVPLDQLRLVALHRDEELNRTVRKVWGNIQPGTPEEKLATVRRFKNDLRAGSGDADRGRTLFQKHCATCHKLFNEGGTVGPDLTPANRFDADFLLVSVVDPSAVVKSQYLNYTLTTRGGGVLQGILAEQNEASVALVDARAQKHVIPRSEVEEMRESSVSLMPEKLLEALSPQELRDLFAYLQRKPK